MLAQEMSRLWLMLEAVSSDTKIQNSLEIGMKLLASRIENITGFFLKLSHRIFQA